MAPSSSTSATADERDRKRKRGAAGEPGTETDAAPKWRTRREHEIYSTKLLDALRLVRAGGGVPVRAREVREAADRALAVAARGSSRWSRAVLASRRARRVHRVRLHAPAPAPAPVPPRRASPGASSSVSGSGSSSSSSPALARKAKALGRLVPGCRKLPFPALLSETSDYIAALEMQVRAMAALWQALSAVSPPP